MKSICLIVTTLFLGEFGTGQKIRTDFTPRELEAIQKLRSALGSVSPYETEYKDYMRSDEYLYRFLKDRNFNVEDGQKKFIQTLKWRREQKIDGIVTEEMSDMPNLFHYEIGKSVDLQGNPLLLVPYGGWNVRRFMVRGNGRERMKRYSAQLLERGAEAARDRNATWGLVIINMNGYSVKQHGCAACIPFYYDLLTQYEAYYPGYVKSFHFINTPRIWEEVSRILLPLISSATKDVIKIYGYNKVEWQDELLKTIARDQLPPQFGGSRKN